MEQRELNFAQEINLSCRMKYFVLILMKEGLEGLL
jgi:hypothetical protein